MNRQLAWVFLVVAGFTVLLWLASRDSGRHGGAWGLIAALWVLPIGPLFLGAAAAHSRNWRIRWMTQLLPIVYPLLIWVVLRALFG